MMITTASSVAGFRITRTIGLVKGNTIRARHVGRDVMAKLKMLVGGEVEDYTKMMAESREQALDRLIQDARSQGANAIVDMKFSTSYIMTGAAEILAYGTAVIIENGSKGESI